MLVPNLSIYAEESANKETNKGNKPQIKNILSNNKKKFRIKYYLNLSTKENNDYYSARNYFQGYIDSKDINDVTNYYKVYYEYPTNKIFKAKYIFNNEHHYTIFFNDLMRQIKIKYYIRYFRKWNALRDIPDISTEITPPSRLYYIPDYYKVRYIYIDNQLEKIKEITQIKDNNLIRSWNYEYNEKAYKSSEYHKSSYYDIDTYIKYYYDEDNNAIKTEIFDGKGNLIKTWDFKHEDKINIQ